MGKRADSGVVRVAGRLLWAALALSSCVLPQNDEPLPEIPKQKNLPPRLIRELLKPGPPKPGSTGVITVIVDNTVICPMEEVSAGVEDPDIDDLLRVKWTIYNADGTKASFQVDPQTVMGGALKRNIVAPADIFSAQSALTQTGSTGTKHLELIVADGELTTTSTGAVGTLPKERVALPDGGFIDNPTYLDSYTWPVETIRMPCQ